MARKLYIPLSAAVAGALIAASPAAAATVTDCATLQDALDTETTVTLAQGLTCTGEWNLPSDRSITLEGAGSGATLDGDNELRILTGIDHGTVVIRNLTFTDGWTPDGGGAIYASGSAPITIADSTFTDNEADEEGGAVLIENQVRSLDRTAARTAQGGEGDRVTITGNTFGGDDGEGNDSGSNGGALAVDVAGDVMLADNEFVGNEGVFYGGGADVTFCGTATVTGNIFEDNQVEWRQLEGRVVAGLFGGSAFGGGLSIEGACFQGPVLTTLEVALPPDTIEQSGNVFRANSIETGVEGNGGGAGEFTGFADLSSTDDTFHANTMSSGTTGTGGGLDISETHGGAVLRNVVATANTMSSGRGGGVAFSSFGDTLSIVHGTIAGNAVGEGEGSAIFGGRGQALTVDNSIVHGNTGGTEISGFESAQQDRAAAGADAGGVDVAFSDACGAGGAALAGEGNICADPKLAGVAGGNVRQTAVSPTLDKASQARSGGLTKDFEGQSRFVDYDRSGTAQPDMGADEAAAPDLPQEEQPQQQQPAAPVTPAAGGVLGTQARSCTSRRSFRIKLRNHGQKVVKATVTVNGKRVKVLRGKRLTSRINLRGLPKGRFSVRIKLELANGKTISGVRRYLTCTPGRRSGPPKV